jgi:hypothetical protein
MATTTMIERLYLIRKYGRQTLMTTRKTELAILNPLPPAVQAEVISAVMEREQAEGVQQ